MLYRTIRGMYAGGSQPAKSDIAADKVAKSLMADLDKVVKEYYYEWMAFY